MDAVRTKSLPGRPWLLGRGGVRGVRLATRLVRMDSRASKAIGRDHVARPDEPVHVEIPVVPDVLALALAQLVRDRWAAERRGHDEDRGRLRVVETRQDP